MTSTGMCSAGNNTMGAGVGCMMNDGMIMGGGMGMGGGELPVALLPLT